MTKIIGDGINESGANSWLCSRRFRITNQSRTFNRISSLIARTSGAYIA